MLNSYILLAISIVAEAIASSLTVATKGFTNPKPTIVCILGYSISYGLFGIALLGIDLGIAYATWSSVGIIATSCVSYLFYKQKLTKIGYISLLVIMISTITLNLLG